MQPPKCPGCGADLAVVGVIAFVREAVIYMGGIGGGGMQRVESKGREVDEVKCRRCMAEISGPAVEELRIA